MAKAPIILDLANLGSNPDFCISNPWDTDYIKYDAAEQCLYTIEQSSKSALHFGYINTNKSKTTNAFLQIEFSISNAPNAYFWVEETSVWFRFLEYRGNTDDYITVTVPLLDEYSATWAMQVDFKGPVADHALRIRKMQIVFEENPPVEPSTGFKTCALTETIYDSNKIELDFKDTTKHYPLFYTDDVSNYFLYSIFENGIKNIQIPCSEITIFTLNYDAPALLKGFIEFEIETRSNPMGFFLHYTKVECLKKDGTTQVLFNEAITRDYIYVKHYVTSEDTGQLIFTHQTDPDASTSADRIFIRNVRLNTREYKLLSLKERIYTGASSKTLLTKERIQQNGVAKSIEAKEKIVGSSGKTVDLLEDVYSWDCEVEKLRLNDYVVQNYDNFIEASTDFKLKEVILSKLEASNNLSIYTTVLNNISYALFKAKQKEEVYYTSSQHEGILAYYQVIPDLTYLMFAIKCSEEATIEYSDFDNPNLETGKDVYYLGPAKVFVDANPAIGKPITILDTTTHLFVCKRSSSITVENPCINFYISNSTFEPYVEAVYYADDKTRYHYETETLLLQEKTINHAVNGLEIKELISNSFVYEEHDFFGLNEIIHAENYKLESKNLTLKEEPQGILWYSNIALKEWTYDNQEVILKDLYRRVDNTNAFKLAGNAPYDLTEPLYVGINGPIDFTCPMYFNYNIIRESTYKYGLYHVCYTDQENCVQHASFKDPYNKNINFSAFMRKFLDSQKIPYVTDRILYIGINLVDVWVDNFALTRSKMDSNEFAIKETVLERGLAISPEFLYYTWQNPLTLEETQVIKPLLATPIAQSSVDKNYYTSISFKSPDESIPKARILDGIYLEITKPVKVLINGTEVTSWALSGIINGAYCYQITDMNLRCNDLSDIFTFMNLDINNPYPEIRRFEVAYSHFPYQKYLNLTENITQIITKRLALSERIIDKAFHTTFPLKENLLNLKMNIYYLFMKEKIIRDGDKEGYINLPLQEFIERPMTKDNLLILDLVPTEPQKDQLPLMEYTSLRCNEEVERLSMREKILDSPYSGYDKKVMVEIIR